MVDGKGPVTKRGFLIVWIDTGKVQHILALNEDIKTVGQGGYLVLNSHVPHRNTRRL